MKTIFLIQTLIIMSTTITAQQWVDTDLYPFKSNFLTLENGMMHYVDEGKGETILFIHGTPTWSFLYREQIKTLSKTHRCIAIDHLGFGLSKANENFIGTPENHAKNLEAFVAALGLDHITLVVHDFGGPIGLSFAIQHPDKIKKIVMMNTWLWETQSNPEVQKVNKLLNSKMGKFLYLSMNISPKVLLKKGFYDKKKLTKKIHKQYIKPFPNKDRRKALLQIGKSLHDASDWYESLWHQLDKISDKPWLIIWGTEDQFINTSYLERWKSRLPQAKIVSLKSGHFVQEEQYEEVNKLIQNH